METNQGNANMFGSGGGDPASHASSTSTPATPSTAPEPKFLTLEDIDRELAAEGKLPPQDFGLKPAKKIQPFQPGQPANPFIQPPVSPGRPPVPPVPPAPAPTPAPAAFPVSSPAAPVPGPANQSANQLTQQQAKPLTNPLANPGSPAQASQTIPVSQGIDTLPPSSMSNLTNFQLKRIPPETKTSPVPVKDEVFGAEKSNVSQAPEAEPDLNPKAPSGNRKAVVLGVSIFVFVVLAGAGVFAFQQYQRYSKAVPPEQLLPSGANLVIKINSNPDSNQYKLLGEHLGKFPGYGLLREKFRQENDGKTMKESIDEELAKDGLKFDADIKPILGENAYFVISDVHPLGKKLMGKGLTMLKNSTGRLQARVEGKENMLDTIAMTDSSDQGDGTKVMGTVDEMNAAKEESESPVDFIFAIEINDLKKAEELSDKLDKNNKDEKYEITEYSYHGYKYFKSKSKDQAEQEIDKMIKSKETFDALLGKNYVIASKEQDMKDTIDRLKQKELLKNLFSSKELASLATDENYQKVMDNINANIGDSLGSLYYNVDMKTLMDDKTDCASGSCSSVGDYVKYPQRLMAGLVVQLDEEGVLVKSTNNQYDFGTVKANDSRIAKRVPEKLNGKWNDVFFEYSNPGEIYYNFKNKSLTDKGFSEWSEALRKVEAETNINLEKDFFDQINGNLGFMMFAKGGQAPEGAMVVEIKDEARMLEAMKKVTEAIKKTYGGMYSGANHNDPALKLSQKQQSALDQLQKERQRVMAEAQLKETVLPEGKIYSFKMSDLMSFDFGLSNNMFILGTNYATIESLMKEMKNSTEKKLADNAYYKKTAGYGFSPNYGEGFINTIGLWNSIQYALDYLQGSLGGQMSGAEKEEMFAAGAVFRTVKMVGVSSASANGFQNGSLFLNIVALPEDQKMRAENIMQNDYFIVNEENDKGKDAWTEPDFPE